MLFHLLFFCQLLVVFQLSVAQRPTNTPIPRPPFLPETIDPPTINPPTITLPTLPVPTITLPTIPFPPTGIPPTVIFPATALPPTIDQATSILPPTIFPPTQKVSPTSLPPSTIVTPTGIRPTVFPTTVTSGTTGSGTERTAPTTTAPTGKVPPIIGNGNGPDPTLPGTVPPVTGNGNGPIPTPPGTPPPPTVTPGPTLPPTTTSEATEVCALASQNCGFGFKGFEGELAKFSLGVEADMPFTTKIISRTPREELGVLNSNGITPEFIFVAAPEPITLNGNPRFTPTHFKPFPLPGRGSGIGHQTFTGNQMEFARGSCVRVFFTSYQTIVNGVVVNVNPMKSDSKCVVFMINF